MNRIISKTTQVIASMTLLVLAVGTFNLPASAQDHQAHHAQPNKDFTMGKKGEAHFSTRVKVGTTVLKPGMYQVQHLEEGGEHVLIFKEMSMPAGYRMFNTPVGEEVARIKCRVEPAARKAGNTKITLRANAAGEQEIAEV